VIAPLTFSDEAAIETLVQRFISRSLPRKEWTHEAHLAVGLWHVLSYPFPEASDRFRNAIRAYNRIAGTPSDDATGYHETMTLFFLHALSAYVSLQSSSTDRLTLFNSLPLSRLRDKMFPLAFYSRLKVISATARREWQEPDILPMSALSDVVFPSKSVQPYYLRQAAPSDASALMRLMTARAESEKLPQPNEASQLRFVQEAFSPIPRFESWLAIMDRNPMPAGYAIFLENYSGVPARPTLYIEEMFVSRGHRRMEIANALLGKAMELAHQRGCRRVVCNFKAEGAYK
jgi:hypothetical protein